MHLNPSSLLFSLFNTTLSPQHHRKWRHTMRGGFIETLHRATKQNSRPHTEYTQWGHSEWTTPPHPPPRKSQDSHKQRKNTKYSIAFWMGPEGEVVSHLPPTAHPRRRLHFFPPTLNIHWAFWSWFHYSARHTLIHTLLFACSTLSSAGVNFHTLLRYTCSTGWPLLTELLVWLGKG